MEELLADLTAELAVIRRILNAGALRNLQSSKRQYRR